MSTAASRRCSARCSRWVPRRCGTPTLSDAAAFALRDQLERSAAGGEPVVGLPVYGSIAAASTDVSGGWSHRLNLDPRRRVAAGLGVAMVRDHQEALVDEAWRQAGDIDRARRERQGALLADLASSRLRTRMVEPLTASSALVTMAPALGRTVDPSGSTRRALVAASAVPTAMLDGPMRRIAATKLPCAARQAGQGIRRAIAVQNTQVLFPGAPPPMPMATTTVNAVRAELANPTPMLHATSSATAIRDCARPHGDRSAGRDGRSTAPGDRGRPGAGAARDGPGRTRVGAAPADADPGDGGDARPGKDGRDGRHRRRHAGRRAHHAALQRTPRRLARSLPCSSPVSICRRTRPGCWRSTSSSSRHWSWGPTTSWLAELLWRGVPLDRRTTLLTQFFESQGTTPPPGMRPVAEWDHNDQLGDHVSFGQQVVLILRSHVVAHLDQTTIFLAPAVADGQFRKPGTDQVLPSFRGSARLDTAYFGFPVDEATLTAGLGWYLVIQELVGAVRFGFDEQSVTPAQSWNDLGWTSIATRNGYVDAAQPPPAPAAPAGLTWGADAGPHGRHLPAAADPHVDPRLAAPPGRDLMPPYTELDVGLPIVLLPVRVETRWFAVNADLVELRVRIFPLRLHTYVDRPGIDPLERDQTITYWRTRHTAGEDALDTETAWNRLVQMFGEVRAIYLRRLLTPTVVAGGSLTFADVPVAEPDDAAVLSAIATGLPTRFFVAGYQGDLEAFRSIGRDVPAEVAVGPAGEEAAIRWQTDFAAGRGDRARHPSADDHADRLDAHPPRGLRRARGRRRGDEQRRVGAAAGVHAQRDGVALAAQGTATNNTPEAGAPSRSASAPDDRPRTAPSAPGWPRPSA